MVPFAGLGKTAPPSRERGMPVAALAMLWPEVGDQPQNPGEKHSRNGHLGHLEGNVRAVADELGADLDQLLPQVGSATSP